MPLVIDNLACRRAERLLFEKLSLTLARSEALLLAGQNGTGKTSLLRILAGLLPPSAGHVAFQDHGQDHGQDRSRDRSGEPDPVPLAEQVHFIGMRDGLKAAETGREMLRFWSACLGGEESDDAIETAIDRVGLAAQADLPCAYLSAGQRRRLTLARLFVAPRPVWLLDEPTNALDDDARRAVHGWIARHLGEGGIAIVASHWPIAVEGIKTLRLGAGQARLEAAVAGAS